MKVLLCPDSYKGSLTALEVAEAMEEGIRRVFPESEIQKLPIADGGEGTVETLIISTGGIFHYSEVSSPLGEKVKARWGVLGDRKTVVMEMAEASGLELVPKEKRNPRFTTTFGTGEMIRAALDEGYRKFIIGIGGSATNDGGAGMIQALGGKFLDKDGVALPPGGKFLKYLDQIDLNGLDPRLGESSILVACDVDNPLCGKKGASAVYGPQKGATPAMVEELDQALARYGKMAEEVTGIKAVDAPGSGAAGGLGAAFLFFTPAKLQPGIEIILDALLFDQKLADADWILTGEGKTDFQTAHGKGPVGIAMRAAKKNVPVLCLSGGLGDGYQQVLEKGIQGIQSIVAHPEASLDMCMKEGRRLVADASEQMARLIQVGQKLK